MTNTVSRIWVACVVALYPCAGGLGQEWNPDLNWVSWQLSQFADSAMSRTRVPGMSAAIVFRDRVVFARGWGVREAGEEAIVTPETVFQLAGVSKPVSATLIARLVTEGFISADDAVTMLDPGFQLADEYMTRHVTLRDLLSHRSGLPGGAGNVLESLGYNREEVLRRLRYLPAGDRFRLTYADADFPFTEAVVAAAKERGDSYEKLIWSQLFQPLGMTSSSARYEDFLASANRSALHVKVDGSYVALYERNPDELAAAGGISSNVQDLTNWMRMLLAGGRWNGQTLIDSAELVDCFRPQILRGFDSATGKASFYGTGWAVDYNERGQLVVSHRGAFTEGAGTVVQMVPEDRVGIVVLTNGYGDGLAEAVAHAFYDLLYYGRLREDRLAQWQALVEEEEASDPLLNYAAMRPPSPVEPSAPLSEYAGSYYSDYYGDLEIRQSGDLLTLVVGPRKDMYPLTHWSGHIFTYPRDMRPKKALRAITFQVSNERNIESVVLDEHTRDGTGTYSRKITPE